MSPSTAQVRSNTVSAPVPRGDKRRREIAATAEIVIFENGFADTTMQMIAERAGASKETLYRHFGNKEELFAEIVAGRARCFLEDLDERFEQPGSVVDVLASMARKILEAMTATDAISLCRTVVGESIRNPHLGTIFMQAGPDRVRNRLSEFLSAATVRGELKCIDPTGAARIFIGAVMSSYHLNYLVLPNEPSLPREQILAHVDEVLLMFMQRYGTAPSCA